MKMFTNEKEKGRRVIARRPFSFIPKDESGHLWRKKVRPLSSLARAIFLYCLSRLNKSLGHPAAVLLFLIFLLNGRPGYLVRRFLAAVVTSPLGWFVILFPGTVVGRLVNFLSMFGQIIPYLPG